MKTKNTFGIHFVIRTPGTEKTTMSMIYARITVNGQRTEISLKLKISSSLWDAVRGQAKGKSQEINKINEHIERVRSLITDSYYQLIHQRKVVTVGSVKDLFLGIDDSEMSILKLIEYHDKVSVGKLSQGTLKNYSSTTKYILKYLMYNFNRRDIFLSELDYKFIFDFESFLRNCKPIHKHQPLNNNGIIKHMERLKKIINLAVTMQWIKQDPFPKYKLKYEATDRKYLSKNELNTLINKKISKQRLESVLDMFLFSCYTGLAFIDIFTLKPSNIVIGNDDKYWIHTRREKSKVVVKIPLLPEALELIAKYKNDVVANELGKVFPVISNQKMNYYLKEIGRSCKFTKELSFHMARHTFATTVTLNNGVPMESVSKTLGHKEIRTTQIYAKVLEYKLSEDMDNLRIKMAKP
jgi:site-specific recombinase XerD